MHLADILDPERLEALIASRHIVRVRHPSWPLSIYDYTTRTQFEGCWTPETRAARGLVAHDDGRVLARPLEKFFNLGEHGVEHQIPEGPVEAAEKLDGSLVLLWSDGERPATSTRGSFTSNQARWAGEWLRERADLRELDPDLTLCFEFVSGPRNRIVVDYGEREEAVLVAARRISDGSELDTTALRALAERHRLPVAASRWLPDLGALLAEADTASGIEGWVVRLPNGARLKVKTSEYRRLHKLLFGLTPASIRDAMLRGGHGPEPIDTLCAQLPEEYWTEVRAVAAELDRRVEARREALTQLRDALLAEAGDSRRQFAALAQTRAGADAGHLFALLDGRDPWAALLRQTPLDGLEDLGPRLWRRLGAE